MVSLKFQRVMASLLGTLDDKIDLNRRMNETLEATRPEGDRTGGGTWQQGSSTSLLMALYAGQVIKHPAMENPTLVLLTDRNALDDQLYAPFSRCRALLRQTPQQAGNRHHLRELLDRPSGGVIQTQAYNVPVCGNVRPDPQQLLPHDMHVMYNNYPSSQRGAIMATLTKRPIQVYLEEAQSQALRRLAKDEGVSLSELIRRGVDLLLAQVPVEKDPAWDIIGLGSSGVPQEPSPLSPIAPFLMRSCRTCNSRFSTRVATR